MSNMYIMMNAWREILARTLEEFSVQDNVSPEWLVNPATRRRLKLDCYYPEAGIAVRFIGLTAKGQKRQSDWEVLENEQRDQTRLELCRLNGVQLSIVDPLDDPLKQLDNFMRVLSRAKKATDAAGGSRHAQKQTRQLEMAWTRASELRSRIARDPEQMMSTLAESWRDRETGVVTELRQESVETNHVQSQPRRTITDYRQGQHVHHERFGPGIVTEIAGTGAEATISIVFAEEQSRTFLTALVQDKLYPLDE